MDNNMTAQEQYEYETGGVYFYNYEGPTLKERLAEELPFWGMYFGTLMGLYALCYYPYECFAALLAILVVGEWPSFALCLGACLIGWACGGSLFLTACFVGLVVYVWKLCLFTE